MNKYYNRLRQQPETARAGIQWNSTEDATLIQEIEQKLAYETIALNHKRTLKSVQYRAIVIGMKKYKDKTLADLTILLNLPQEIIENYIKEQEEKQKLHEEMTTDRGISLKDMYDVMVDIRSLLERIAASREL